MLLAPIHRLILLLALCAIGACSSSSNSDEVTGKGSIRAIHAIPDLNTVSFLIEETVLASIGYQESSGTSEFDDLEYEFRFDILLPGDDDATTLLSTTLQVDSEFEHTFVLGGSLEAPELILWEQFSRDWAEEISDASDNDTEVTVMEVSFGNLSTFSGPVDIYLESPGTSPEFATPRATVSYSELQNAVALAAGEYQLVITPVGDASTILYATDGFTVSAATSNLFAVMDDGGQTTADYTIRWIGSGLGGRLLDINLQAELSVVHAALGTDPIDVFVGGDFTNPIIAGLDFMMPSASIPLAQGSQSINVTPENTTGVFLLERDLSLGNGSINRMYIVGYPGDLQAAILNEGRRSIATHAIFQSFQAAVRYPTVDIYLVKSTVDISLINPTISSFVYGTGTGQFTVQPGDYLFVVTQAGTKNIVGGPYRLSLAAGDILGSVILDSSNISETDIMYFDIGGT